MPLRKWFVQHGLPSWYSWLVVVGTNLLSSALVLVVCLTVTSRADRRTEEALAQMRAGQEASRAAACTLVISQDEAFNGPGAPEPSPVGKRSALAWHNLRTVLRCP